MLPDLTNGEPSHTWRPRLNPELKIQIVDGEAIVLDRPNERVHRLNETATFIIQRCDGTRSSDEIIGDLLDHYDAPEEIARRDATDALSSMRTLDILR